jgi:hypothetical protein
MLNNAALGGLAGGLSQAVQHSMGQVCPNAATASIQHHIYTIALIGFRAGNVSLFGKYNVSSWLHCCTLGLSIDIPCLSLL